MSGPYEMLLENLRALVNDGVHVFLELDLDKDSLAVTYG